MTDDQLSPPVKSGFIGSNAPTLVGPCILYPGCLTKLGYGVVSRSGKKLQAHRVVYEQVVGKIPEGMQLDHLCRNRACINPSHLEPVTGKENVYRGLCPTKVFGWDKETCRNGHSWSDKWNVLVDKRSNGQYRRVCVVCRDDRVRRVRARKKRDRNGDDYSI